MQEKRFRMETACPQCGCSAINFLSEDEMKERYGNVANIELECGECMRRYHAEMKTACPEWAKECGLPG